MKDRIKNLFANKWYSYSLLAYVIIQLASLVIHNLFLYTSYLLFFLIAIVIGVCIIVKEYKEFRRAKSLKPLVSLNLIAALLLTAIYIPTLLLNAKINWSLAEPGRNEFDPFLLLIFFPGALFLIASTVFLLTVLILRVIIKKN